MKLKKLLKCISYNQQFKIIDDKTDKLLHDGVTHVDQKLLNSKIVDIITEPETAPDTIVIYVVKEGD